MSTPKKVLLLFNDELAEQIRSTAKSNAEGLNELCETFPFTSREEYQEIFSNPRETFNGLLRRDPKVVELEQYVDIETIKIPPALHQQYKTLGLAGGPKPYGHFENVKFDAKSEAWVVDEEAVKEEIERRCPVYLTNEQQLMRLEVSKSLCKWLNSEQKTQDDWRRKFEGQLRFSPNRPDSQWNINPDWILGRWPASQSDTIPYAATRPDEALETELRKRHPVMG